MVFRLPCLVLGALLVQLALSDKFVGYQAEYAVLEACFCWVTVFMAFFAEYVLVEF